MWRCLLIMNIILLTVIGWDLNAEWAVNLDAQNIQEKKIKYPVQSKYFPTVESFDLQDLYAINFNFQYYNMEKKEEALEHLWNIKINNLPLEQKATLILNTIESKRLQNKIQSLKIGNFLIEYNANYAQLNRLEKLNLIKYDLTKDTQYLTPEVQQFLRLRQNQLAP